MLCSFFLSHALQETSHWFEAHPDNTEWPQQPSLNCTKKTLFPNNITLRLTAPTTPVFQGLIQVPTPGYDTCTVRQNLVNHPDAKEQLPEDELMPWVEMGSQQWSHGTSSSLIWDFVRNPRVSKSEMMKWASEIKILGQHSLLCWHPISAHWFNS